MPAIKATHILMTKSCEDLYLTKSTLTIGLMLKWSNLFDGYLTITLTVLSRAVCTNMHTHTHIVGVA